MFRRIHQASPRLKVTIIPFSFISAPGTLDRASRKALDLGLLVHVGRLLRGLRRGSRAATASASSTIVCRSGIGAERRPGPERIESAVAAVFPRSVTRETGRSSPDSCTVCSLKASASSLALGADVEWREHALFLALLQLIVAMLIATMPGEPEQLRKGIHEARGRTRTRHAQHP